MNYKSGLEIKKAILIKLKEKEYSLKQLERKTNTGYAPIKKHCEELAFLKMVEIKTYKSNKNNGRPYKVVKLTDLGRKII